MRQLQRWVLEHSLSNHDRHISQHLIYSTCTSINRDLLYHKTGAESLLSSVAQQLRFVESIGPVCGQRHQQDRGGDRPNSTFH